MPVNSTNRTPGVLQRMQRHLDEYILALETYKDQHKAGNHEDLRLLVISPRGEMSIGFPTPPTMPSLISEEIAHAMFAAPELEPREPEMEELKSNWDQTDRERMCRGDVAFEQFMEDYASYKAATKNGLVDLVGDSAIYYENVLKKHNAFLADCQAYNAELEARTLELQEKKKQQCEKLDNILEFILRACYRVRDELASELESAASDATEKAPSALLGDQQDTEISVPQPGYLGIILNDGQKTVERDGWEGTVSLSHLQWNIMAMLFKKRANWLPETELEEAWEDADVGPEKSAMNTAVSALRKKLESLGITIESQKLVGRRLKSTSEQPPKKAAKPAAKSKNSPK